MQGILPGRGSPYFVAGTATVFFPAGFFFSRSSTAATIFD
jgi:hypothetical protein